MKHDETPRSYKYEMMRRIKIHCERTRKMDLRTCIAALLFPIAFSSVTLFYGPCNTTNIYLVTVNDGDTITHELQMNCKNFSTYQRTENASWSDVGQKYKNWTLEQMFALQALLTEDIRKSFGGSNAVVSLVYVLNSWRTNSNRLLCINDTLISNHTRDAATYWRPTETSGKTLVSAIENYTEYEKNYTILYKLTELLGNATLNCTCTHPNGTDIIQNKTLNCTERNFTTGHASRPMTNFSLGASCGTVEGNISLALYDLDDDSTHSRNATIVSVFVVLILFLSLGICIFVFRERLRALVIRYMPV